MTTVASGAKAPVTKPASPSIRLILPVLLAVLMTGVAELLHTRDVLFPEGLALCLGVAVMGRPDWAGSRPRLVIAPVVCATCGWLAVVYVPTRLAAQLVAMTAAFVVLWALRSRVSPALSAAVLPTVFDVRSWIYPVAVLALMVLVMAVRRKPVAAPPPPTAWGLSVITGCWAVFAVWLALVDSSGLPWVAAAPPLFVSAVEWVAGPPVKLRDGLMRGALLAAGWAIGAIAAWQIPWAALAGLVAVGVALALATVARTLHAPILAMALVAQVSGPPAHWSGVLAGLGSVVLAVAALYSVVPVAERWSAGLGRQSWLTRLRGSSGVTRLRQDAARQGASQEERA